MERLTVVSFREISRALGVLLIENGSDELLQAATLRFARCDPQDAPDRVQDAVREALEEFQLSGNLDRAAKVYRRNVWRADRRAARGPYLVSFMNDLHGTKIGEQNLALDKPKMKKLNVLLDLLLQAFSEGELTPLQKRLLFDDYALARFNFTVVKAEELEALGRAEARRMLGEARDKARHRVIELAQKKYLNCDPEERKELASIMKHFTGQSS